jgi:hypothetical protein
MVPRPTQTGPPTIGCGGNWIDATADSFVKRDKETLS